MNVDLCSHSAANEVCDEFKCRYIFKTDQPERMSADDFVLNPALYGLPDRQQLKDLRIWSEHYHGFMGGVKQHEEMWCYVERMGIE